MTYAPHRSAPTREVPSYEDGTDVHRWRTRLWVAGGVAISTALVAFGVWAVVTTPETVMVTAAEPDDSPVGIFDFDVTALRCGTTSVGPEGLEQKAAGQFCLLDLRVTNNSGEPEVFVSGEQRVQDTNGVAYAVAEEAAVFLNDQSPSLLGELDPGETVTGVLPFDVPSDVHLSEAVLTGGMSTPGVRVKLPDPR
ncbi:DUF4352 domain-containing protein [Actinoplanes italicus]|uniref:DUF4352 domain-containing protein n=1 Tax=Actinoplanes italicus TaxID=113567 RepID=UPI000D06240E|nr:DUF4352 domain-containing protein [Actinoplanes italicus]